MGLLSRESWGRDRAPFTLGELWRKTTLSDTQLPSCALQGAFLGVAGRQSPSLICFVLAGALSTLAILALGAGLTFIMFGVSSFLIFRCLSKLFGGGKEQWCAVCSPGGGGGGGSLLQ